jgi:hypothetical protein
MQAPGKAGAALISSPCRLGKVHVFKAIRAEWTALQQAEQPVIKAARICCIDVA